MVLYYSATGNTRYAAEIIAEKLGDTALDLLPRIKAHDYSPIYSEKPFVICSPVYVCEMPVFLRDHLKMQRFSGNRRVYFVFSAAGYAGIAGILAEKLIKKKNMKYMGHAELKMPRNYTASNMYPQLETDEIKRRIKGAAFKSRIIASVIKKGGRLRARHVFLFETLITLPFTPLWIKFMQPSKDFYTTDKCIGCGKCASLCPLGNISLENKRPVWEHPCAHCMACIGNCPVEAIEYGNITQDKVKYNIKKYL